MVKKLNVAGKPVEDKDGQERVKRAFDGLSIALRSSTHKKAFDDVTGDGEKVGTDIKDNVIQVLQEKLSKVGTKEGDKEITKKDVFNDLNKEGAFDAIYQVIKKDNKNPINEKQAEAVFNSIKKEANIVASSVWPMLFVGKMTSRLSQLPLLGSVVSGMNGWVRNMSLIGKSLGDMDVNNAKNFGTKGHAVFDVQSKESSDDIKRLNEEQKKVSSEHKTLNHSDAIQDIKKGFDALDKVMTELSVSEKQITQDENYEYDEESKTFKPTVYNSDTASKRTDMLHEVKKKFDMLIENISQYQAQIPKEGIAGYRKKYSEEFNEMNASLKNILGNEIWGQRVIGERVILDRSKKPRFTRPALAQEATISQDSLVSAMASLTEAILPKTDEMRALTDEQKKDIIEKGDPQEILEFFNNKTEILTSEELENYAKHENPIVREMLARSNISLTSEIIKSLLNQDNLRFEGSDFKAPQDALDKIGAALLMGEDGTRQFEDNIVSRFLESSYYPISRALVRLKKHQLGAENIDKLLQRCSDDNFDVHVYSNGNQVQPRFASGHVQNDLASGVQDLTSEQFKKIYNLIGQEDAIKFLSSPRPLNAEQRKLLSCHQDPNVRMKYQEKNLESVTKSFEDLEEKLTKFKNSDSKALQVNLPQDIEDHILSLYNNINAYTKSLPKTAPMRDEYFKSLDSKIDALIILANKIFQNDILKNASSTHKTSLVKSLRKWGENSIINGLENFQKS